MNEEKCCHLKCKNGECPDIRVLKQGFEKWMSAIEINADKYTTNILSGFDEIPNLG